MYKSQVLEIGGAPIVPPPGAVHDRRILVTLDASDLSAGVCPLRLIRDALFEAVWWPMVLRPRIDSCAVEPSNGRAVVLKVAPPIRAGQSVQLLLDSLAKPVAGQTPPDLTLDVPVEADTNQVKVVVPGLPGGRYAVRLRVDGAESLLSTGPDGFTAPVAVLGPST